MSYDTKGVLRALSSRYGAMSWVPVLDTSKQLVNPDDHYAIVGLAHNPMLLRLEMVWGGDGGWGGMDISGSRSRATCLMPSRDLRSSPISAIFFHLDPPARQGMEWEPGFGLGGQNHRGTDGISGIGHTTHCRHSQRSYLHLQLVWLWEFVTTGLSAS